MQKGEETSRRTEAAAENANEEAEQQQCTRSGSGNRGDDGRERVGSCAAFLQIARERDRERERLSRPKTRFGLGSASGSENSDLKSEGMYEIYDLSS